LKLDGTNLLMKIICTKKVFEDNNHKYPENIYGYGKVGERIVEIILKNI